MWHGVPVGVHRARLLPARVSDAEWERVVDLLRAEFKTPGAAQQIGRRREWASAASSTATRVTVEEREDGDLVTIETPSGLRFAAYIVAGIFASLVFAFGLAGVLGGRLDVAFGFGAAFLTLGSALYGALLLVAKLSSNRTPARADRLLDRIDLLSRTDDARASGRGGEDHPARVKDAGAGRLDLDDLPDATEGGAAARRRDRA